MNTSTAMEGAHLFEAASSTTGLTAALRQLVPREHRPEPNNRLYAFMNILRKGFANPRGRDNDPVLLISPAS
jgi:hypothetical protein